MVTQQPGSARTQVSRHFCTLTNPSDGPSARPGPDRSRDHLFAQLRRPGIYEPCSRRSPAGSIAAPGHHGHFAPGTPCSRRSPAGSIAASQDRRQCGKGGSCSRRSPAGSIAAASGVGVQSATRRAPAVHRRAPLRRRRDFPLGDDAQRAPAVHRRAPLRRAARRGRSCQRVVLPPFTGRLHCGGTNAPAPAA